MSESSNDAARASIAEQPARSGPLGSFSSKEAIILLAAVAVAVIGIAAAALSPDRSVASSAPGPAASAITSAAASPAATSEQGSAVAAVPATATSVVTAPATETVTTDVADTAGTTTTYSTRTTAAKKTAKKKAVAKKVVPVPVALISVGAVINYGTYGGAPLQWRVLDADANGFLLLSKYVVSAGAFQSDWEGKNASLYSGSEVRMWLKDDFTTHAFDTTQSAALLPHLGGPAGSDRVFLLSAAEITRYLPKAADRKAAPLSGASQAGFSGEALSLSGPYASWWLADPGTDDFSAQVIEANGKIGKRLVYYADLGVRPAIRVNRDRIAFSLDTQGGN
jgi:hypothetical protein